MIRRVFLLTLGLWFLLSVGRVGNNVIRALTSEREWIFLTDSQKKEKLLGEVHNFLTFIQKNTPPSSSIAISLASPESSPGFFYKSLYYLYPRKIEIVDKFTKQNFDYLIYYYPLEYSEQYSRVRSQNQGKIFSGEDFQGYIIKNR